MGTSLRYPTCAFLLLATVAVSLHSPKNYIAVNPNFTPWSRNNVHRNNSVVTMVMFDKNYQNLFDCWADLFAEGSSHPDLDVITLDNESRDHVKEWQAKQHRFEIHSVDHQPAPVVPKPSRRKKEKHVNPKFVNRTTPNKASPPQAKEKHVNPKFANRSIEATAVAEAPASLVRAQQARRKRKKEHNQWELEEERKKKEARSSSRVATAQPFLALQRSHITLRRDVRASAEDVSSTGWPSPWYMEKFWPMLHQRLLTGVDVLHLDLDALAVTDPWKSLDEAGTEGADIISSIDGFPNEVKLKWGFALNTGFMLFRNTPAVRKLVQHFVDMWEHDRFWEKGTLHQRAHQQNEQTLLNNYLASMDCKWEPRQHCEFCKKGIVRGQCGDIRLVILNGRRKTPCGNLEECRKLGMTVVHTKYDYIIQQICDSKEALVRKMYG